MSTADMPPVFAGAERLLNEKSLSISADARADCDANLPIASLHRKGMRSFETSVGRIFGTDDEFIATGRSRFQTVREAHASLVACLGDAVFARIHIERLCAFSRRGGELNDTQRFRAIRRRKGRKRCVGLVW